MNTQPQCRHSKGFALVITLSLMVLLTVIAVGLLTLSAISLRSTAQGDEMATARANARLALMLALGDLQKTAGTDRAITAPAAIIDEKKPSGITGVWSPWDAGTSATPRNKAARDGKFKQWLVSTSDGKPAVDPASPPMADIGGPNAVTVLGNGSLGNLDDQRINLPTTRVVNGRAISGLAWAVIDESIKSRVDLYQDSKAKKAWTNVTRAGAPPVDGLKTMTGWDQFVIKPADDGKLVSVNTLALNGSVARRAVSNSDPDVTVSSNSLLTDPVNGGLKKDLSLLSSRGLSLNEKNARLYKSTGVIADSVPSDPFLSLLTNYHQLYKRLGQQVGSVSPGPYQVAARLPDGFKPYDLVSGLTVVNRSAVAEPLLVPSVVRVDMIFSMIITKTHGPWIAHFAPDRPYEVHLQFLPIVTLHNPYSVPLKYAGMYVAFKNLPVGFNFVIDGQDLSSRLVPLNQMFVAYSDDSNSKDFYINLAASISGGSSTLTLEPGQTKLFGTPKVLPSWTWNDEVAGNGVNLFDYRNDLTGNANSAFTMAPKMMTQFPGGGGFCIDWVNPTQVQTTKGAETGKGAGMCGLKGTETIAVKFGPYAPPAGQGSFSVTIGLGLKSGAQDPPKAGGISIKYGTQERLNEILAKGTSVRFPTVRNFPEMIPKAGVDPPITASSIYEEGETPISQYVHAKQFMIFSLAAKTTLESFIPAQTLVAGNPTTNVAVMDLTANKDPEGSVPFEMVMMPIRAGSAAIEDNRALEEGYFFSGNGSSKGTPRATLFEFPVAPLTSLAQLRHANLAGSGYMPFVTYTVGESMAHPLIGTNVLREKWTDNSVMLDHTFLANEALWDSYYLSTIADQSGPLFGATSSKTYSVVMKEFFEGKGKLLNSRYTPYNRDSTTVPEAVKETAPGNPAYTKLAAYLMLAGGFNVNSTSENAWKAVLSSLDGADIETVLGVDPAKANRYPTLRVRRPAEKNIDDDAVVTHQKNWQGYRRLTKTQVDELAKEIVKEIRTRGPFLSLADFVNRNLGAESDVTTLKGALQAALDRTTINAAIQQVEGKELAAADVSLNGYKSVKAGIGNSASHAPGMVTQGDVLSALGARVTVRADTFRIRGYGEARDATGRKILAKAWCEAVVQRVPDYVDPADPAYAQYSTLNGVNKKFGRRYEIVSFRWLGPKEV